MIFAIVETYMSFSLSLLSLFSRHSFSVLHFHPPDLISGAAVAGFVSIFTVVVAWILCWIRTNVIIAPLVKWFLCVALLFPMVKLPFLTILNHLSRFNFACYACLVCQTCCFGARLLMVYILMRLMSIYENGPVIICLFLFSALAPRSAPLAHTLSLLNLNTSHFRLFCENY